MVIVTPLRYSESDCAFIRPDSPDMVRQNEEKEQVTKLEEAAKEEQEG
jgi:hypothetical protein